MGVFYAGKRWRVVCARWMFVVSHPIKARMGTHFCGGLKEADGGSWYPTLAARTKTPRGWGTQVIGRAIPGLQVQGTWGTHFL